MNIKHKLKKNVKIFLYLYVLFFVLYLSVVTLSKFSGFLQQDGNVQVAKWEVSVLANNQDEYTPTYDIVFGDSNTYPEYKLSVENLSEVALEYTAIIRNIPDNLDVYIDDAKVDPVNHQIEFSSGLNASGTKIHDHILKFKAPMNENSQALSDQTLDVDVIFKQKSFS